MARKDKENLHNIPVEDDVRVEETVFESEAYGTAQPDAGMETTVTKPVGIGGPVPIVAPKHSTVQLQPIVVPLAVVPYMTQDSDVLRTDGTSTSARPSGYGDTSGFTAQEGARKERKKRNRSASTGTRVASLVLFIFSAAVAVGYLLAYFAPQVLSLDFAAHNVIGTIIDWVNGTAPTDVALAILYIVSACFTAICVVFSLIGVIIGKLPTMFVCITTFVSAATIDAALIYRVITGSFVVADDVAEIVMAAVASANFVLCIVFFVALSRKKGDIYGRFDSSAEI